MEDRWDPKKRERCLAKRGIDFLDAGRVFESPYIERNANKAEEERFLTIGVVEGRPITVVWTWRNGVRRIITTWHSSRRERRAYHEFINGPKED